jgi:hypothetical protein
MSVRFNTRLIAGLFIVGALQQFLSWRLYVHLAYGSDVGAARSFVNHPLTNFGICLAGSISTCVFGTILINKSLASGSNRFLDEMLRAGKYGFVAGFSAVQAFYLLASTYLAVQSLNSMHGSLLMLPGTVVLWLIEFEFDGVFAAALCVVVSFLVWFLAAGAIKRSCPRCPLLRGMSNSEV